MFALLPHLFDERIKWNELEVLVQGLFFGSFRLWLLFLGFMLSRACFAFSSRVNHHGVILRGRHGLFNSQSCDGNILVANVKAASMLQTELGEGLLILPLQLLLKFVVSE